MKGRKLGDRFLLRLVRGEEVMESIRRFLSIERIPGATLTGIGASDRVTVGFYDIGIREYRPYTHEGRIEITSLVGNIAWRSGEPVIHIHVTAAEEAKGTFGGHLIDARVAATMEISLVPAPERLTRTIDPEIGLPLLDLPDRLV
ncbi:MAG TPA: DUF296 domain-containing protein [Candidatus Saccharimonadales bacterium]|nr:DUF296 domain-containing protein [Candidatus Saccharimonadales bacterium]